MSGKEFSFFKRALGVGKSQKSKSAQGADSAQAGQGAQAAQAAQSTQSAQAAQAAQSTQSVQAVQAAQSTQSAQAAPAAQGAQAAQVTQAAQSTQAAQAAPADQGAQASQTSQETTSKKRTLVVKPTPIPDPPRVYVGQGALKKQPMPGLQSAQSSTRRQESLDSPRPGRAPVPDSPRGYGGQGAVKRQPDQATLRRQALEAQIEQRRQGVQGSPRAQPSTSRAPFSGSEPQPSTSRAAFSGSEPQPSTSRAAFSGSEPQPSTSRAAFSAPEPQPSTSRAAFSGSEPQPSTSRAPFSAPEPQPSTSQGFTGSLSRLAWVTHKGLETWARLARDKNTESESTRDVNINPETRTVQPSTSTSPHVVNPDVPTSPFELPQQARSCSGISGRTYARLNRTPSMSSQGSMDSATGKQGSSQDRNHSGQMYDEACGFTIPTSFRAGQCSSQGSPSSSSSLAPGSPRTRSMMKGASVDSHGVPSSPYGQLQPELYSQRNSPLIIALQGRGPSLGRLHLRLGFDYDRSDLTVHIIEIHDLPFGDEGGFNEPYIRMEMVPEVDNKKRETNTVANNNNPLFDQHFKFPIAHDELDYRTLIFQIYDFDHFTESDIIGEVRIEMSDLELVSSIEIWADLARIKKPREEYQELLLSLSYLPSAQRLTIVVLKARNLYIIPSKGTVDPFVKIYLMAEGKRTKKRKTHTKKNNRNPVWNEAFTFNIASSALSKAIMEVCVYDHTHEFMYSSNQILGSCLLGLEEEGNEREHWVEVTGSPRKTVAMWHTLR